MWRLNVQILCCEASNYFIDPLENTLYKTCKRLCTIIALYLSSRIRPNEILNNDYMTKMLSDYNSFVFVIILALHYLNCTIALIVLERVCGSKTFEDTQNHEGAK